MTPRLPVRRSGRVLLVNQDQQILLFRAHDLVPGATVRELWFPVGGGAEGDESFAECASRELFEETGLRIRPEELGPVVATRNGPLRFDDRDMWADEAYFFVPISGWEVDVSGFTELERQVVTDHRWWSIPELRATDRIVFPAPGELASLLSRLIATGPDGNAVELPWERLG